jgi:hypothetical protein
MIRLLIYMMKKVISKAVVLLDTIRAGDGVVF